MVSLTRGRRRKGRQVTHLRFLALHSSGNLRIVIQSLDYTAKSAVSRSFERYTALCSLYRYCIIKN